MEAWLTAGSSQLLECSHTGFPLHSRWGGSAESQSHGCSWWAPAQSHRHGLGPGASPYREIRSSHIWAGHRTWLGNIFLCSRFEVHFSVLMMCGCPTALGYSHYSYLPIEGTGPYLWAVILHQLRNRTHSLAQGTHAYSRTWSCSVSSLCEESILLSCACENVSLGDPDICQTQRALTFWGCCSQCGQQVTLAE